MRQRPTLLTALLVAVLSTSEPRLRADDREIGARRSASEETIDLAMIAARLRCLQDAIQSLRIVYAEEVSTVSWESRHSKPSDRAVYLIDFAANASHRYLQFETVSDEYGILRGDPIVYSRNASGPRVYKPVSRILRALAVDEGQATERTHLSYVQAIGVWMFSDQPPPDPAAFLPDAFTAGEYRLLPHGEVVDGIACRVVENPGRDRIWFDPDRDYAIIKRESYSPMRGQVGIINVQAVRLSQFRKVGGDIWLPFTAHTRDFIDGPRAGRLSDRREYHRVIVVSRVDVNTIENHVFQAKYPPGTVLIGHQHGANDAVACISGGEDLIDGEIARIGRYYERRCTGTHPGMSWRFAIVYGVPLALTSVAVTWVALARAEHFS